MTETVDDGAALEMEPESALKLPLAVKAGLEDERIFELVLGSSVTAILDVFAAERGCRVEELIMFREGEDEPLSAIILMEAEYPKLQQMTFAAELWVQNNNWSGDYRLLVISVSGQPPQIENLVELWGKGDQQGGKLMKFDFKKILSHLQKLFDKAKRFYLPTII